jgi:hypothetical protein
VSLPYESVSFIHPEIIRHILEPTALLIENTRVTKDLGAVELGMVRFNCHCLPCWVISVGCVAQIMGIIEHVTLDFFLSTVLKIFRVYTMGAW